jgi:hypothetical protein
MSVLEFREFSNVRLLNHRSEVSRHYGRMNSLKSQRHSNIFSNERVSKETMEETLWYWESKLDHRT